MEKGVIYFDKSIDRLRRLGTARADNGDYLGALCFFYQALNSECDLDDTLSLYMDIAACYSDMETYELSNKFWFKYLDRAPKDKVSIAYEELGINFFYMNNLWLSGYYFHKKFEIDGFISPEGLDKEIVDFFSNELDVRDSYRLVYPLDLADYSKELTEAKRCIASSDFKGAERLLKKIPQGCPQYGEALNELSMLKFVLGDNEEALEYSRKIIEEQGESLTAYCNLSSIYHYKKDDDKSAYYFSKVMEFPVEDLTDVYKVATCSLEQGKHLYATPYLENILQERPYDYNMRYLYALALINLNAYDKAIDQLSQVLMLSPDDQIVKYYLDLAKTLRNEGDRKNILPLKYIADLPDFEVNERKALISDLANMPVTKINSALKNKDTFDKVAWGIKYGDEPLAKASIVVMASSTLKMATNALIKMLIDNEIALFVKEMILYCLVMSGCKNTLSIVKLNCFAKVKPRKLRFELVDEDHIFFVAYAFCFSRLAFTSVTNLDKVAFAVERIYKKLKGKNILGIEKEEMAAYIAFQCGYKDFKREKDILRLFGADKNEYNALKGLVENLDED